ncbi:MAG TPA: type IV secretion system protein VirB10 [Steroidobacteraceae bacterium]|nr:type IV secretion system protein VirB10 [Steroidobacteraceae bacterium]
MLSLQSRLSHVLAIALMLAMGAVFLCWYYAHMLSRPSRMRQNAQSSLAAKASGEMSLPSLGQLDLPQTPPSPAPTQARPVPVPSALLMPATSETAVPAASAVMGGPAVHATALERRLSGAAFASGGRDASPAASGVAAPRPTQGEAQSSDTLSTLLASDSTSVVSARWVAAQRMLLPKGAFIDCTLETAIDSSLPGLTTCVTATDTFGADGRVVLLERGTKLVGETRGQLQQGAARVFVLWTEARTPAGVRVPLDSPGSDELGRSGLPGQVDRHFWERFGAAILISTLDGGVQAAVQSASRGSGTVIYSPSGPQDVTSEVLKGTLGIAPTVIKHNGDRIQILVARDVDFSRVYELRHAVAEP